jgi:phosphopantothenoylcysteine synthetase/decarboxylase
VLCEPSDPITLLPEPVFAALSQLRYLHLRGDKYSKIKYLIRLAKHCTRLTELDLRSYLCAYSNTTATDTNYTLFTNEIATSNLRGNIKQTAGERGDVPDMQFEDTTGINRDATIGFVRTSFPYLHTFRWNDRVVFNTTTSTHSIGPNKIRAKSMGGKFIWFRDECKDECSFDENDDDEYSVDENDDDEYSVDENDDDEYSIDENEDDDYSDEEEDNDDDLK